MGKVAVFDSGLGSLSIILAIRKITKADIVYFADQKNYPYGKKSTHELRKIIKSSIKMLEEKFQPDVIIVGSNTPTLLFPDLFRHAKAVIGVLPPLVEAREKTKTNSIAILGTTATIQSRQTKQFIKNNLSKKIQVYKIDASKLIDLVESGKFISNKQHCNIIIKKILTKILEQHNIDIVTLSSTHLPFLLQMLKEIFPQITFLDPAMQVATQLRSNRFFKPSRKNSLQIFTSGNITKLQNNLNKLKIRNKIKHLEF
jgi:glutamate racemase